MTIRGNARTTRTTRTNTAEKADAGAKEIVVILSDDRVFRAQVEVAFRVRDHGVVGGPVEVTFLEGLEGWQTRWRALEAVACVVIDLGGDAAAGPGVERLMGVLDAVRRRDHSVPVVMLARALGSLSGARLGANVIVDGPIEPEDVVGVVLENPKTPW
jgi:hypothetical protein